jgi:hypothetical protein
VNKEAFHYVRLFGGNKIGNLIVLLSFILRKSLYCQLTSSAIRVDLKFKALKEGKKGEQFVAIMGKNILLWLMAQIETKFMFRKRIFLR